MFKIAVQILLFTSVAFAQGQAGGPAQFTPEQLPTELATAEVGPDFHQETTSAPGVEYIEVTNLNRDIEVGLKNGFAFTLSMNRYGSDALKNYYSLPMEKREKFLRYRVWFMNTLAGALTAGFFAPGIHFMARDTIYYIGKKTEWIRELHQNHMQRPTSENIISLNRPETWTYQPRDWTPPQKPYRNQIFDLYFTMIKSFDEQLVRMSGILNIYNKTFTQDWIDFAIVPGASIRGGSAGGGKTPPMWMTFGIDWEKKTILWRPQGENERSILGQSFSLPSIRIAYSRAGADPSERDKTLIEGQNYQPWGPFSFSVTPDRTSIYMAYDVLSLIPVYLAYQAGAPAWLAILTGLMPTPSYTWLMSSVGQITRAEFFEGSFGFGKGKTYFHKLPGSHMLHGIVSDLVSALSAKSRNSIRNARQRLSVFKDPKGTVERFREARQVRLRNYRPESCNLIFGGPVPFWSPGE